MITITVHDGYCYYTRRARVYIYLYVRGRAVTTTKPKPVRTCRKTTMTIYKTQSIFNKRFAASRNIVLLLPQHGNIETHYISRWRPRKEKDLARCTYGIVQVRTGPRRYTHTHIYVRVYKDEDERGMKKKTPCTSDMYIYIIL